MAKTACAKCRHLIQGRSSIWYDLHCEASPMPPVFDPLSDKMVAEQRFQYVREVNKGHCELFEAAS